MSNLENLYCNGQNENYLEISVGVSRVSFEVSDELNT